jgi:acyl-CoA thioester hydrolase
MTSNLTITYRGAVYPWQCDHIGHMNVMWYAGKFDEASWQFLSHLGVTRSALRESNRAMAAVQQNISYKREIYAGDLITIRTGLLEVKEKTIKFLHTMENDETGLVAAEAEITGVYFDALERKAAPLPEDISRRAQRMLIRRESPNMPGPFETEGYYDMELSTNDPLPFIKR